MCGKSDATPAALAQALRRNTAKPKNAGSIPAAAAAFMMEPKAKTSSRRDFDARYSCPGGLNLSPAAPLRRAS